MPKSLKIIFAGTPEFAATALEQLIASNHDVVAVYTQPDRPAGRGRKLKPSPVKELALANGLAVFQPVSLKDHEVQQQLADQAADLMIVAAYGLILPKAVLDLPPLGCINIHASLLPRWRGAAPIQRAILAGDAETGITIMQMDVGLDTGDMLLKLSCTIEQTDTAASLHDKLAELGAQAVTQALEKLTAGELMPQKQDDSKANYATKLEKAEAIIDWTLPALDINRQVRAFNPWPVAQTQLGEKVLRIWEAELLELDSQAKAGTIIHADKRGIDVATGMGVLRLKKIQLPGGKPMDVASFLNSNIVDNLVLT